MVASTAVVHSFTYGIVFITFQVQAVLYVTPVGLLAENLKRSPHPTPSITP